MNALTSIDHASRISAPADAAALAPASVSARIVRLRAISDEIAAAWDDLADHAAEANAFQERWFLQSSIAMDPDARVRIVLAYAGDMLIGLMPLARASHYGRLPIAHAENWLHYHSFLGGPLLRRGREIAAWTAILHAIDTDPASRNLLHLTGLAEGGPTHRTLLAATSAMGRPCDTVHRIERALLESDLAPEAYYAATVRKKKRKEIGRLQSRLSELGAVTIHRLTDTADLPGWIDAFLSLEQSGWKGRNGSALGCDPATATFFRDAIAAGWQRGRVQMLRLDLDDRPLAMLVNFVAPPGSFSFKTAFDEDYARYSPGVLVQLANLDILHRADIGWMDSCASADHPMINSLWGERRHIVRVTLPLAGWRGHALFHIARAAERAASALRTLRARPATPESPE
ncbi:MAG: GNAT family N-acetyltransferase [Alphaproteobacteria bacterium HGW-Alphaproteobacteria-16]|nr:MAG: GNAT family N-acetyltransferase [Alphaproteobacteria bacterium HGW-Alphaproteobacteria-16]